MSKEATARSAMKLALEALEISPMSRKNKDAIDTLREALAAPDFWDGYAPEPVKQQALDRMAENARELGLDYEPAQRTWVGLTDEETGHWAADFLAGAKWAEAKLRSKNNG